MMDRDRKDELPKMQMEFIDVVCKPLFTSLSESFPWIKPFFCPKIWNLQITLAFFILYTSLIYYPLLTRPWWIVIVRTNCPKCKWSSLTSFASLCSLPSRNPFLGLSLYSTDVCPTVKNGPIWQKRYNPKPIADTISHWVEINLEDFFHLFSPANPPITIIFIFFKY